jgi:hypothetical protein
VAGSSIDATSVVPSALTAWQPMHRPELSCTGCAPVPGAMRVMWPTETDPASAVVDLEAVQ